MRMSFPQVFVALASLVMLSILLLIMVVRKLRTKFPLFFALISLYAVVTVITIATFEFAGKQYFYVYWSLSFIVMVLSFAVMYEVFVNILKPFSAVIDLAKTLFSWAGLFLLAAGFLTALVTSGPSSNKIVVAVDLCDRCVHMIQCGLLMLVFLLEKRLNFSWRSSGMSIALGLGFGAALDLVVSYGQMRFPQTATQLDMVNGIGFVATLAFWAFALKSTEQARKTVSDPPTRLVLQRWNEALIAYGYGDAAFAGNSFDSFLPGVEQTVDRVLARKIVQ